MIITKSRLGILSLINHHHISSLNRGYHALNPVYQLSIDKLVKNKEIEQIEISCRNGHVVWKKNILGNFHFYGEGRIIYRKISI